MSTLSEMIVTWQELDYLVYEAISLFNYSGDRHHAFFKFILQYAVTIAIQVIIRITER